MRTVIFLEVNYFCESYFLSLNTWAGGGEYVGNSIYPSVSLCLFLSTYVVAGVELLAV